MSETITAGHLNATRLGKRITINSLHGTVVSGSLKKNPRRLRHHAQFHHFFGWGCPVFQCREAVKSKT